MSGQSNKKKTVAQVRAAMENHKQDAIESCQLAFMVNRAFYSAKSETTAEFFDRVSALLPPSDHACEQLLHHLQLDTQVGFDLITQVGGALYVKARIHNQLGQHNLAVATFQRVDELFIAAERKGELHAFDHECLKEAVSRLGLVYLVTHQLEAAKRCFLRILAWPCLTAAERVRALEGMARYHKDRQEWVTMTEWCEEALLLVPEAKMACPPRK